MGKESVRDILNNDIHELTSHTMSVTDLEKKLNNAYADMLEDMKKWRNVECIHLIEEAQKVIRGKK